MDHSLHMVVCKQKEARGARKCRLCRWVPAHCKLVSGVCKEREKSLTRRRNAVEPDIQHGIDGG